MKLLLFPILLTILPGLPLAAQITVPAGCTCSTDGFRSGTVVFQSAQLPRPQKSLRRLQAVLDRTLGGSFTIARDNILTGAGYRQADRQWWFAAASPRSKRYLLVLSASRDAHFSAMQQWLSEAARDAVAMGRRWEFVDAAGRRCSEGLLERD